MERCDVTAFLPVHSFARACDCRAERIIHKLTLGAGRWAMVESWKAGNIERWKGENAAGENVDRWKGGNAELLESRKMER